MAKPKGGRPTTWSKKLEEKAWEYVNGGWQSQGDAVPMVVGLCAYIERSQTVIYDWEKHEDKEFADILEQIREIQHLEVFSKALKGDYNSTMAKLMLTKHGYSDKTEQEVTIKEKDPAKRKSRIEELLSKAKG